MIRTIRKEQMQALRAPLLARLHQELLLHVKKHFAKKIRERSDEELLNHIRRVVSRAFQYGFRSERQVYNYVNISMILGPDFDRAEEMQWTRKYLLDPKKTPTIRIDGLFDELLRRLEAEEDR
jgi:hypothetical protein